MSSFFLGLDTSAYTTSAALVDERGALVEDRRAMLQVKPGEKGLRQSEAHFQHGKNLPLLFEEMKPGGFLNRTAAIAASCRPRPAAGSYMPVFLAGEGLARSLAAGLAAQYVPSTHQEGHIMAGLWSQNLDWENFWVFHVSGGTTELLEVSRTLAGFAAARAGGSQDLAAGQFIDRVGVKLGLPFPAGSHLEKLSREASGSLTLPVAVKEREISFSGPETRAGLLLQEGAAPALLARAVEECVARSLAQLCRRVMGPAGGKVLFVGGVMANERIKSRLSGELEGLEIRFSSPGMSGDNAVGLAEIARRAWAEGQREGL